MKPLSNAGRYAQRIFNVVVLVVLALSLALNFLLYRTVQNLSLADIDGVSYFEEQENLFDPAGCEDFFYDYDGSVVASQNGSVMSNWIPCSAGQQITRNGIATNVVCYFDADKNFLQRVDSYGFATITVPDDDAIAYVAQKAIDLKTGARGIRTIMETKMLELMFDLPDPKVYDKIIITKGFIENGEPPILVVKKKESDAEAV